MVRAVALEECATNGGQMLAATLRGEGHSTRSASRRVSLPGHACAGAAAAGSELELGGTAAAERMT